MDVQGYINNRKKLQDLVAQRSKLLKKLKLENQDYKNLEKDIKDLNLKIEQFDEIHILNKPLVEVKKNDA